MAGPPLPPITIVGKVLMDDTTVRQQCRLFIMFMIAVTTNQHLPA